MLTISEVNEQDFEEFVERYGNVVENCPLAAGAVWSSRPFNDLSDLHRCFSTFLDSLPFHGQQAILRIHPDLAGRMALQGALTRDSASEQASAGLTTLTEPEARLLTACNDRYKERFGFTFVVCARLNKKAAILSGIEERLKNESDVELQTGIEEVKKITLLRLQNIVQEDLNKSSL